MERESASQSLSNFQVALDELKGDISISDSLLDSTRDDDRVHVNLRYFHRNQECFCEWQKNELKAFSRWLDKVSQKTVEEVRSDTKDCHIRRGTPKLPKSISPEAKLYSLRVTGKARVHGIFSENNFFLVYLDRNHKI